VFAILVVIDRPTDGYYYGAKVAGPVFKNIADAALRYAGVPPTINPIPPVVIANGDDPPALKPVRATAMLTSLREQTGPSVMPDVRGLSARDALNVLTAVGLSPRVAGSGFVVSQTPLPGAPVDGVSSSAIELDRAVSKPKTGSGGQ
jgi:cell division protein FtsI (penicillin-binding protein 3)